MSEAKEKFDHNKYANGLKLLVEHAYKDYHIVSVDFPRHQAVYLRTYLWLASLLAAFELSGFAALYRDGYGISLLNNQATFWFYFFAALALGASLAAFVLGTDTLRGRGTGSLVFGDATRLAETAHADASSNTWALYNTILKALAAEINQQATHSSWKAKRLRAMSLLLLASVGFSTLAIVAIAVGPPK